MSLPWSSVHSGTMSMCDNVNQVFKPELSHHYPYFVINLRIIMCIYCLDNVGFSRHDSLSTVKSVKMKNIPANH